MQYNRVPGAWTDSPPPTPSLILRDTRGEETMRILAEILVVSFALILVGGTERSD
jgi:hypothetical protein